MKLIFVLLIVAYSSSSNAVTTDLPLDLDINDIKTFKGFDNKLGINPWKDSIETIGQKFVVSYTLIITLFIIFFQIKYFLFQRQNLVENIRQKN
jgi:hypothetical protein